MMLRVAPDAPAELTLHPKLPDEPELAVLLRVEAVLFDPAAECWVHGTGGRAAVLLNVDSGALSGSP